MSKISKTIISVLAIFIICIIGYNTLKKNKLQINLRGLSAETKGLEVHNKYRRQHHVAPLKINKELTTIAQKYAELLAAKNIFEHSKAKFHGKSMGENIYANIVSDISKCDNEIIEATKFWYNEVLKYNYNKPGFSFSTGHFTQVVWKDSREVGFGIAYSVERRECYIVANYYPAGNVEGKFTQNVLRK